MVRIERIAKISWFWSVL